MAWKEEKERGLPISILFVVWLLRLLGPIPTRIFLRVLTFYYAAFDSRVRKFSRQYLSRMNLDTGFASVHRHIYTFAVCAMDRMMLAIRGADYISVNRHGSREALEALLDEGCGALILGAHVGSFEMLRMGVTKAGARVHVLADFSNASNLQSALDQINPDNSLSFIDVSNFGPQTAISLREKIAAGDLVAVMADRVTEGQKSVTVQFLGEAAQLPAGPLLIASMLHCPVFTVMGLTDGDGRYDVYFNKFADEIKLPRKNRQGALEAYAQEFADWLEEYVKKRPYNWFNFFPFWDADAESKSPKALS